ncbi:hypothetical protein [Geminocystis herdmanii]|uniref:hypothetical protein n=1 Tax=Geminocystis herdmanii TaxID=669359 RepID=UPI00034C7983|nr:hypothetical protein [Geminocystis herdmanii]
MEATKLKGIVNQKGQLIIEESINLSPGEVEIVILKIDNLNNTKISIKSPPIKHRSQTFKDLLENQSPTDENFNVDGKKWDYLKDKHNL